MTYFRSSAIGSVVAMAETWLPEESAPVAIAPCRSIPVTDEMRRRDAAEQRRRELAAGSVWPIKRELSVENLRMVQPKALPGRVQAGARVASEFVPRPRPVAARKPPRLLPPVAVCMRLKRADCPHYALAYGVAVCVVDLADCVSTNALHGKITRDHEFWGDFGPGRFAFRLDNVRRIPYLRAVGRQGFFDIDVHGLVDQLEPPQGDLFADP